MSDALKVDPRGAVAVLALATFLVVGELWLPGRTIADGDLLAYFPSLYKSPLDGFWNPMVTLGAPQLPNPQTGVLYPPAWLLAWDFILALPLYTFLHLFGGALGMWALARRISGDGVGALLAGIAYGCGGAGWSLLTKLDKMPGYTFLPWVLLGAGWLLDGQGGRARAAGWWLTAGSLMAITLGGSVEGIPTAAVAVALWVALSSPWEGAAAFAGRLVKVGLASALGLMASACILLPFVAVIPTTMRSVGLSLDQVMSRSTHVVDLVGWILHSPLWDVATASPLAEDGGVRPRFLNSLYGGLPALMFIPAGLVGMRRDRRILAAAVGALVFMALALGEQNPLYVWAYHHVPFVDGIRYPEKWWLGALPFHGILVACGWEAAWGDVRARRALGVTGALVLGGAALAAILATTLAGDASLFRNLPGATPLPTLAAASLLGIVYAGRRGLLRPALVVGMACAVLALDLLAAERRVFPVVDAREAYAPSSAMLAMTAGRPEGALPPLMWDEDMHRPGRDLPPQASGMAFYRQMHEAVYPNTGVPYGIAYVYGMHAFRMLRPHLYTQAAVGAGLAARHTLIRRQGATFWRMWSAEGAAELSRALGLTPVPSVVRPGPEPGLLAEPRPLPPLRWVGRVHRAPDVEAALGWLAASPPDDAIVLSAGDRGQGHLSGLPDVIPGEGERSPPGDLHVYRLGDGAWEVEWEAREAGALLLAQSWAPGWAFSLDDGPFEDAIPADVFMMAAPAPAGRHHLLLRYVPKGFVPGMALSALALALLLLAARWEERRDQGAGAGPTPQAAR